jgi:hypothetical protein
MQEAIGEVLVLAVGVALVPVPIIAVTLLLLTDRARLSGPLFVVGWLLGLGAVGAIVLLATGSADADDGPSATWVDGLRLLIGLMLLWFAVRSWRGRPGADSEPVMPRWMDAITSLTPVKALGAGAVLAAANPKNLALCLAAGAAIAQTGIPGGQQVVAYGVFALVATIGVATPVVIFFALGDDAGRVLERLRTWMARNNAVIIAVLLLVIGVKLVGDAIGGLGS